MQDFERPERFWEITDDTQRAQAVYDLGERLRNEQGETLELDCEDYRFLYEGFARDGSNVGEMSEAIVAARFLERNEGTPSYNVVQASVDTLTAHTTKSPVRPFFLTEKGNHKLKKQAEGMSQAVEATFEDCGIYSDKGKQFITDALVNGAGHLLVEPDFRGKRVRICRVMAWELFYDLTDSRKGAPQTMVYTRLESRAKLEADFHGDPEALERIRNATPVTEYQGFNHRNEPEISDFIRVVDAWHLPSFHVDPDDDTEHDGYHSCSIETGELDSGAYSRNYFPTVDLCFKKRFIGARGRGIPEMLLDIQAQINEMLIQLHGIMRLHSRPLIYLDRRAKINTDKITNSWGSIIQGTGPGGLQYITPQAVPAEYIRQLDTLRAWGFQQVGISELVSQGTKPAGIESGRALRTLRDEHSLRHSDFFKAVERAHIDLAIRVVDTIREIAETCKGYKVMFGSADDLKKIDWSEVNLPRDKYQIRVWPTNLFSQTPAARREEVAEMVRDQIMPREMALQALDFPDVKGLMGDLNVYRENIERQLDALEEGKQGPALMPHPYLNLALAKQMVVERINRLERDGMGDSPPHEAMVEYAEQVDELMAPPEPPVSAGLPLEGAPVEGAPPPPPPDPATTPPAPEVMQ